MCLQIENQWLFPNRFLGFLPIVNQTDNLAPNSYDWLIQKLTCWAVRMKTLIGAFKSERSYLPPRRLKASQCFALQESIYQWLTDGDSKHNHQIIWNISHHWRLSSCCVNPNINMKSLTRNQTRINVTLAFCWAGFSSHGLKKSNTITPDETLKYRTLTCETQEHWRLLGLNRRWHGVRGLSFSRYEAFCTKRELSKQYLQYRTKYKEAACLFKPRCTCPLRFMSQVDCECSFQKTNK